MWNHERKSDHSGTRRRVEWGWAEAEFISFPTSAIRAPENGDETDSTLMTSYMGCTTAVISVFVGGGCTYKCLLRHNDTIAKRVGWLWFHNCIYKQYYINIIIVRLIRTQQLWHYLISRNRRVNNISPYICKSL